MVTGAIAGNISDEATTPIGNSFAEAMRGLLEASDEEILEAARTLGMNPEMRGSAAYLGLKFPEKPKVSDFFNLEAWNIDAANRLSPVTVVDRKASPSSENAFRLRTVRKDSVVCP